MKRDAFGDDGPSNKRQRNPDDEVTLLIPSRVAGSIIGKGGTNISKLRSQYKASITVPDCPGPERVLTITAPDLDTTLDIVKDILPNLADNGPKAPPNEELDVRVLIHQSRAGCVIGKAGAKIKELREKTGARLKIFSNPAPQSKERVVQVFGNQESIIAGLREVIEITRQTPIKGPIVAYDPHNYDDFYAEEYGGFGGGGQRPPARGPPPPRPHPPMGPADDDFYAEDYGGFGDGGQRRPPHPPMGSAGRGGLGGRGGGPPPRGAPRPPPFGDFGGGPRGAFPPPRPQGFGGYGGGYSRPGGPGGMPPGPPPPQNYANNGGDTQQETSTQVTIPKDLAGAIIGKAGSRIRNIRMDSGAGIEIAEPLPGSSERIITITGSPHQIQMAQYLLQQSVHESNPNLARGGNY